VYLKNCRPYRGSRSLYDTTGHSPRHKNKTRLAIASAPSALNVKTRNLTKSPPILTRKCYNSVCLSYSCSDIRESPILAIISPRWQIPQTFNAAGPYISLGNQSDWYLNWNSKVEVPGCGPILMIQKPERSGSVW